MNGVYCSCKYSVVKINVFLKRDHFCQELCVSVIILLYLRSFPLAIVVFTSMDNNKEICFLTA